MAEIGEIPDSLLDLIYDAAGEDHLWSSVLQQIAQRLDSAGGILYGQSIRDSQVFFEHNGGLCDDCSRVYRARHMQNPWSLYMLKQPEGRSVSSDEVLALSELRRTAFFDDVLRPQGLGHNAMIGLAARPKFIAAFNINRGPKQGSFRAEELAFLARLVPHMQRSLRLGFRMDAYRALQCAQYEVLDRIALGVVLLNRQGTVLYSNQAADRISGDTGALTLRGGVLSHAVPADAREVAALVQAALAGQPMAAITVSGGESQPAINVLAAALRGRDLARFSDGSLKDAAAMVFISDPTTDVSLPRAWIEDSYGLTPAESIVVTMAIRGTSVPRIARDLRLSPNTVKTHLRRAFAKTGVGGQAELVRLMTPLTVVAPPKGFIQ